MHLSLRYALFVVICLPCLAIRDGSRDGLLEAELLEMAGDGPDDGPKRRPLTVQDVQGKNSFNDEDPKVPKHRKAIAGNTHGKNYHPHRKPVGKLQPEAAADAKKEGEEGQDEEGEEAEKEQEGEEEEEEEEVEPVPLTFWEKVLLEVGWLGGFIVLVLGLVVFMGVISLLRDASKDIDDGPVEPPLLCQKAFWFEVHVMDPLVIICGVMNFILFAAASELNLDPEAVTGFGLKKPLKSWVPKTNEVVQLVGGGVLILGLMVRVLSAAAHPWWKQYRALAPIVGLLLNLYAWVDIIAIMPSLLDLFHHRDLYYNVQAICLIRLVEMAVRTPSSTGAGIKAFIDVFDEEGPLISTIFALGLVVWIFFSGLYMVANRLNPESVWEAAEYNGERWQRFESIPSSMFFTLLNLCKEHPLADVFGAEGNGAWIAFFQRMIIIVVCIVGVPVFGVPTGILGASLMKHCQKQVETLEVQEEEEALEVPPIEHIDRHRLAFLVGTMCLSFGSTFVYFFYTLGEPTRVAFIPVPKVGSKALAAVEVATAVIFLMEFATRACLGGKSYIRSLPHLFIDVAAWLPPLCAGAMTFARGHAPDWLHGLCVLWVLKPERYIGAFASMSSILSENAAILKATALTSFLLWLLVSSLLHFTERNNPDEELKDNYASVPRALWAEIINLHGEWPWCDYTWEGKAIGTFLNFVSIGICMVPVVVFSDAFMSKAVQDAEAWDSQRREALPEAPGPEVSEVAPSRAEPQVFRMGDMAQHRWQLRFKDATGFKLLYSHLLGENLRSRPPLYYFFRTVSTIFILLATVSTIMSSLPTLSRKACATGETEWKHCSEMWNFFMGLDITLTIFFSLEFLARVVVLRGTYLFSFIGIVDMVSLQAFIATSFFPQRRDAALHPAWGHKDWFNDLMALELLRRLMRLMMLESWSPAIQSLRDVVWMRGPALRKACYALLAVWYIFTVCLYVLEKDSGLECSERFENVLVGLPHGLIHLTGDYPCTEYTTVAMPFHLVFLILGMCCTGTFTGIFAGGFVEYLGAERALEREQAKEERLRVMAMVVCVLQRRFRLRRQRSTAPPPNEVTMSKAARRILRRQTSLGRVFMSLAQAALVINVINTMFESMPEIEALGPEARSSLTLVEVVTGIIFCIEFLLYVVAKPTGIFTTPMRIIDFLCCLPTFMRLRFQLQSEKSQLNHQGQAVEAFIECVAACRVVRVLDWPQIRREMLAVKSTLKAALPSLAMPAVISLQLWVLTAGIYVWLENMYFQEGKASDQEHMTSIPDALYWCSIYLLGEWANDEFTDGAGSRMCIFYCLCGVALFSIPVGIMVEAGRATLEKVADEKKELADLKAAAMARKKA